MNIIKLYQTLVLLMLLCCSTATAQTDFTSCITNPSFENNGASGWTKQGMSPQGNDVFKLKKGSTYMEKWTGRGGTVGSAILKQKVTGLAPGNYVMTVAAQNIQEDTPTTAQTGAWIFVDDAKTTVTVCADYEVAFNYVSGYILIGFEAQNATGNYLCVDNFRLTKVGENLSAELAAAITSTTTFYNRVSGTGKAQIKDAIDAAELVAANTSANAQEQADAIIAMENAIDAYKRANASSSTPYDLTSLIENPSFETGDLEAWTSDGLGVQSNNIFSIKDGTYYLEKWTGKGGAVGNGSVSQTIKNMKQGRYRLKATAQNIQQDTPTNVQTGAWIFANTYQQTVTVSDQYSLDFVQVSDELEIGFKAEEASGNWICVDNFRLEFIGESEADVRSAMETLIAKAEALAAQRMYTPYLQNLQAAIDAAKPLLSESTTESWAVPARTLETVCKPAETSIKVFSALNAAINTAQSELDNSSAPLKETYQAAINAAKAVYDATSTTDEQAQQAIADLAAATFAFKIENGTGTAPTVKTDPRFIKGSRWAFGRSTVSGNKIIETGFCWSEDPDPKVTDFRTTEYLNQAGKIYWMRDLKPATMYYMRAYAVTDTYAVGYGDVIKFATLPASNIGHWYNNGGDEATNDRINYAINIAMDYYWGNASSIHDFGISVTYSPGTPTADCSYGGSMRVGASSSYQQPGTIMHEALHGIGVGTHGMWWGSALRPESVWEGDQVTAAIRFWDNNTTGQLNGDSMHMWPYGCNGAQEDSHSDNLYCMMGILAQALNEDGLPAPGTNYALPYYSFTHEDGVKYYIKNEDETHGLTTSYLVETAGHQLMWQEMSAEEALNDDAAAWYITFTPSNQYYQLRNAKTGFYMTYATSTFKTANHSTPTSADDFHFMRGRVDVPIGNTTKRGYYFIHPTSSSNPPTLNAIGNHRTGSASLDLNKTAVTQRWVILTAEEAESIDSSLRDDLRKELNDLIAQIRTMAQTPHKQLVAEADATLETQLQTIEVQGASSTSATELRQLINNARNSGMDFLSGTNPSIEQPYDITFLISNPNFNTSPAEGWTCKQTFNYDAGVAEFYEKTFDFYQILPDMPVGSYELKAQAFQRPGAIETVYTDWAAGSDKVTTSLYIASNSTKVKNICDDAYRYSIYTDDVKLENSKYAPTSLTGASRYFRRKLYDNSLELEQTSRGDLRLGLRCTSNGSAYWTVFDNFRLYFYGDKDIATGVETLNSQLSTLNSQEVIFDLQGRRISDRSQMKRGIYIVNGKKVFVK